MTVPLGATASAGLKVASGAAASSRDVEGSGRDKRFGRSARPASSCTGNGNGCRRVQRLEIRKCAASGAAALSGILWAVGGSDASDGIIPRTGTAPRGSPGGKDRDPPLPTRSAARHRPRFGRSAGALVPKAPVTPLGTVRPNWCSIPRCLAWLNFDLGSGHAETHVDRR